MSATDPTTDSTSDPTVDPTVDPTTGATTATVAALLAAAGLDVPADEVRRLARLYPGLRRSMDHLYTIPIGDEGPAAVFRAAEVDGPTASGTVRPRP